MFAVQEPQVKFVLPDLVKKRCNECVYACAWLDLFNSLLVLLIGMIRFMGGV